MNQKTNHNIQYRKKAGILFSSGVDYAKTHSCYDPVGEKACGRCDACALRLKGFADAGMTDPAIYVE